LHFAPALSSRSAGGTGKGILTPGSIAFANGQVQLGLQAEPGRQHRSGTGTPSVRTANGAPTPAKPQQFRAREQKENIFLTAYAGFPVAPISMTWNFDWGSAWTRWPRALTARSTPIFLDHDDVGLCRYLSIEAKLIASYAGAGRSICTNV
jgi:hypothetical protein